MRFMNFVNLLVATLALIELLTGCASYVPTETAALRAMRPEEARRIIDEVAGQGFMYFPGAHPPHEVSGVWATQDGVNFVIKGKQMSCRYSSIEPTVYYGPNIGRDIVSFGKKCGFGIAFNEGEAARRLADALFSLKSRAEGMFGLAPEDPSVQVAFQEAVRYYRSQSVKPQLPEEARKYLIQAEAGAKEKQYHEAVDLYGKALKVAPWWPTGYFNRGILLGQEGMYPEAIRDMQRYLELEPEARDARAAKDKIYEWERKVRVPLESGKRGSSTGAVR